VNLSPFYRLAAACVAAMLAIAGWGLWRVGPGATVPIHWDAAGNVNGYGPAWMAFLLTPAIAVALVALFAVIPRIEPRRANLERSGMAYRTVAVAVMVLMLGLHLVIVLAGAGVDLPVGLVIGCGIGLLFAVLGNVLTTVRSNYMFGVRTPWTLSSDLAWDRTHRLVGRLFVAGGVLTVLVSLLGSMVLVVALVLAITIGVVVAAIVYSYWVWRDDPDRRPLGGAS
jgi:uncharacterized membrane protein